MTDMRPAYHAAYEAHLAEARKMAGDPDPAIAAQGRAIRDVSLAFMRWHQAEREAGTPFEILAGTLNTVLGHSLAGFMAEHGAGENLVWHLEEIAEVVAGALRGET